MYAAAADLEKRLKREYAKLYADDATGNVDADLVTEDLAAANAEVDGAVGNRYVTPVTSADALPLLKSWTVTLASGLAWGRSAGDKRPEKVTDDITEVRKRLAEVAKGEFRLPGATETTAGNGGVALISGAPPLLDRNSLRGF